MTKLNEMKSESLEEARERLRHQSELERKGFEQIAEGQLTAGPVGPSTVDDRGELQQRMLDRVEEDRVTPSVQDRADQDSVDWTRQAMANAPDAQIHGENAERRSSARKSNRKSSRKAAKKDDDDNAQNQQNQ